MSGFHGTPSHHLKQLVWDALTLNKKLDDNFFTHNSQYLFARIDQIVFENNRMIVRSQGNDLVYWDLPRWSEDSKLTIELSHRSCIEVRVS